MSWSRGRVEAATGAPKNTGASQKPSEPHIPPTPELRELPLLGCTEGAANNRELIEAG